MPVTNKRVDVTKEVCLYGIAVYIAEEMVVKLSGIQKEVLSLYRALLREAIKKDRTAISATDVEATNSDTPSFIKLLLADNNNNNNGHSTNHRGIINNEGDTVTTIMSTATNTSHARNEFRRHALQVNRKDFRTIEHKIRQGYKQIKLLQMPGVVNFRSW